MDDCEADISFGGVVNVIDPPPFHRCSPIERLQPANNIAFDDAVPGTPASTRTPVPTRHAHRDGDRSSLPLAAADPLEYGRTNPLDAPIGTFRSVEIELQTRLRFFWLQTLCKQA